MLSAKEAREISTKFKLNALADIEKRIKKTAETGHDCIWVDYLEDCVIIELEKVGYKVIHSCTYPSMDEYCISWGEDE